MSENLDVPPGMQMPSDFLIYGDDPPELKLKKGKLQASAISAFHSAEIGKITASHHNGAPVPLPPA